jgi:hypothetical protein
MNKIMRHSTNCGSTEENATTKKEHHEGAVIPHSNWGRTTNRPSVGRLRIDSSKIGDTIIIRVEEDQPTLCSVVRTIERLQSMLAEKVPPGYSAVDELIAEREDGSTRE